MEEPRPEKVAVITEVAERLSGGSSVVVTEYRGLNVQAMAELRRGLRPVGGRYKIYKNTLVRRAADQAGVDIAEHLVGPTALAFAEPSSEGDAPDIVSVAKVLRDFAKNNPDLVIKGGLLEGEPMNASEIGRLADLDSREVLLAKFAGLLAAPMQRMAGLLQAVPRDFAYGLKALIEAGGASDAPPAPAEAEAADAANETETNEETNGDD